MNQEISSSTLSNNEETKFSSKKIACGIFYYALVKTFLFLTFDFSISTSKKTSIKDNFEEKSEKKSRYHPFVFVFGIIFTFFVEITFILWILRECKKRDIDQTAQNNIQFEPDSKIKRVYRNIAYLFQSALKPIKKLKRLLLQKITKKMENRKLRKFCRPFLFLFARFQFYVYSLFISLFPKKIPRTTEPRVGPEENFNFDGLRNEINQLEQEIQVIQLRIGEMARDHTQLNAEIYQIYNNLAELSSGDNSETIKLRFEDEIKEIIQTRSVEKMEKCKSIFPNLFESHKIISIERQFWQNAFIFVVDKFNHNSCSICFEKIDVSKIEDPHKSLMSLGCDHVFHQTCLEKWFNEKFVCPLCKNSQREFLLKKIIFEEVLKN